MMARAFVLIFIGLLGMAGSWTAGYVAGQRYGAFKLLDEMETTFELDRQAASDADRDQVCNEIRHYKLSIAKDLDENTQICGWPDMDGQENSN